MEAVKDKAGRKFWDEQWSGQSIPDAANPANGGFGNLFTKRMDKLFSGIFHGEETHGKRLLELGCGSSIWLPYFAKRFGFDISGIDYSPEGVENERAILAKAGCDGDILQADFFAPPVELLESFDVAYSSGVAEHFEPTERVIEAFSGFLRPGGVMITIVPNMVGSIGGLVRMLNRDLYDIHVPIDNDRLREAHTNVGLNIEHCDYFLSSGFGVASVAGLDPNSTSTKAKSFCLGLLEKASVITWKIEDFTIEAPGTRALSPYIVCVARKPN